MQDRKNKNMLSSKCLNCVFYVFPILGNGILRISWVHRVTNETVLEIMKQEIQLINMIERRKVEYFMHIMRSDNKNRFLKFILQREDSEEEDSYGSRT